jgi:hypothetical protein
MRRMLGRLYVGSKVAGEKDRMRRKDEKKERQRRQKRRVVEE